MKTIEPGQVFRVSSEKRLPRERDIFVVATGGDFATASQDWEYGDRHILEPIDASRVTIADEPTPVVLPWRVAHSEFSWVVYPIRLPTPENEISFGASHPDAEKRARDLCAELNERDAPKPKYEVRHNKCGYYVWDNTRNTSVAYSDCIGANRPLADAICAAFNKHAKD